MQIELFNKTVKPILLYGSEIWGFGNPDDLERKQQQKLKFTYNLKRSTPTYMIYSELGVKQIAIDIKLESFHFGLNLYYMTEIKSLIQCISFYFICIKTKLSNRII